VAFSSANASRDLAERDLDVLSQRYPDEWSRLSEDLLTALSKGDAIAPWVSAVKADAHQWRRRLQQSAANPKVFEAAFPHLLRERLASLALQKTSGTVRLGLWSGTVIQRLLFKSGLERKPASMRAFRFWWRFVIDRALLMPLVQPRGIYCFYSRELIEALASLIDGRRCLELAAGDGTLSRFLNDGGTKVTATDDGSWSHTVTVPAEVERLDAKQALRRHAPKVVLCSWPPPGNPFEKAVFETPSVERYIVIGSRHRFAAGNFESYERQPHFQWRLDEALSALVLPPELDPAVYVFDRPPVVSQER
jgi:hypothetical protein